ncbi:MAG: hypothetical protein AB7V26_02695 [Lysobacterales bacterium]
MHRLLLLSVLVLVNSVAVAQTNYVDWAAAGRPAFALQVAPQPSAVAGGLTVFADLASFQAATNGGFTVETFDGGATPAGGVNTCTEPVSSLSNDACFAPGNLIPGFSMTSSSGGGIVVLGDGFLGQATAVVGANQFVDTTSVAFGPAVTAVAFDGLIGAPAAGDITVTALDAGAAVIGSVTVTTTSTTATEFIGFTSLIPIASITIDGVGGSGELLDNLQFGVPAAAVAALPVPATGSWAVGSLVGLLLLLGAGWLFTRTRVL